MTEAEITSSNILARDVSFETYMQEYAEHHAEWVEGMVIKLSPVTRDHDLLMQFFIRLLNEFLEIIGLGLLMTEPFVMRSKPDSPAREPDLHIVLNERTDIVKDTLTDGPADIVIEIISKESSLRDRGEKFHEYEAGGVQEYWLIDPLRREPLFYILDEHGQYQPIKLYDEVFASHVLKGFRLDTRLLWQETLPTGSEIRAMVEVMLKETP